MEYFESGNCLKSSQNMLNFDRSTLTELYFEAQFALCMKLGIFCE